MTIVTKPGNGGKKDKDPLVQNEVNANKAYDDVFGKSDVENPSDAAEDGSSDSARYYVLAARARRVSAATTVCLFVTALLVMSVGIIGGVYLYRQFARSQMQRFRGWCSIPYESSSASTLTGSADIGQSDVLFDEHLLKNLGLPEKDDSDESASSESRTSVSFNEIFDTRGGASDPEMRNGYFHEEFEIDVDLEQYERIDVPDFKGGRRGRFIHDFNANKTGIVDLDGKRCFVMPLNRRHVLPPKNLYDLVQKMWTGYYGVDTEMVRETMRVVTPAIEDRSAVGQYISKECEGLPLYNLVKDEDIQTEKFRLRKRSAENDVDVEVMPYVVFAGRGIYKIDISNLHEIEPHMAPVALAEAKV